MPATPAKVVCQCDSFSIAVTPVFTLDDFQMRQEVHLRFKKEAFVDYIAMQGKERVAAFLGAAVIDSLNTKFTENEVREMMCTLGDKLGPPRTCGPLEPEGETMHNPQTCGQSLRNSQGIFCKRRKEANGRQAPCAVEQGRGDDCPLENTMQSGDSSVIQQGDAGER